jgi:restriction system protein
MTFRKQISHSGLHAYRVVSGQTQSEVETKANLQEAIWAERWLRKVSADQTRAGRAKKLQQRNLTAEQTAAAKALALEQTRELENGRESLEKLLHNALARDARPNWEGKKEKSSFDVARPLPPKADPVPNEPDATAPRFNPVALVPSFSVLDKLISSRRERKITETAVLNAQAQSGASHQLESERASWRAEVIRHAQFTADLKEAYEEDVRKWEKSKNLFDTNRDTKNLQIDLAKASYLAGDEETFLSYIEDVLSQSEYPDNFPKEYRLEYIGATKTLVLDYELPNQTALPNVKEVKYVASRSEFQEVPISDAWIKKTYDEILYQISLRTLYELFQSDEANALVAVVFNGWVRSIDKATGSEVHACVMSLEARKDEFLAINLAHVDPKACFKKFKGVAASKLIELSPVKPLFLLNKEDSRFVDGYAVAEGLDERTNLAAMDWLDFENLIREVFEKEFSKGGGEVKITQASRDGGVDAVAFDPDPIRGGKLVIQAKRYTNTVGISAVRDLYGTVHNEGANKGILVTTSDFGPDAYAFAKDKPLTLISGGELLYLLARHGHSAKIDLAEAKRIAAESGR